MVKETNTPQSTPRLLISSDERLQYFGFEVGPEKTGELFKSDGEERHLRDHVQEKRKKHDDLRDTSNFRELRVTPLEKNFVLAGFAVVILSFFLPFMPWVSGYVETISEEQVQSQEQAGEKNDGGFQSVKSGKTRTKIEKTPYSWSGVSLLASMGDVSAAIFSSGGALIASAILFLVYIALCFALAGYGIYAVLTTRGDPDSVALKLKTALRLSWAPLALATVILFLSLVGADYGFDTTGALKQVGDQYSISTLLGLLGPGFYMTIAGFTLAATKSVEI